MITTIRTCDRCKATLKDEDQLWEIGIGFSCMGTTWRTTGIDHDKTRQWCRPCMERAGLLGGDDHPSKQDPPAAPPTIEDLIRDIVHDAIAGSD